jgi:hypothetical protein
MPQTESRSAILPRALLVAWVAFSVLLVLFGQRSARPADSERSAANYAPVYVAPDLVFPGYPLLPLDVVRNGLSSWLHFNNRNFLAASAFFLTLLILAMYLAGTVARDEWAGLLAALLAGATPFVLTVSRVYDVHITRLAAIALVFAALGLFERKQNAAALAVLLGAWAGGVFLCPATTDYLLFNLAIAGPAAVLLGWGAIRSPKRRIYWLAIIGWAVAAVIVTPALLRYQGILNPTGGAAPRFDLPFNPDAGWLQPRVALAYLWAFFHAALSVPLNFVLGIGIVLSFAQRGRQKWVWGAGLLLPLLVMVVIPKRNMYYVATLIPAACLTAALGWQVIAARARGVVTALFFVAAVTLAAAFSFGWLMPGRVEPPWSDLFVPGIRQYAPTFDNLSMEPFGSVAGNADSLAEQLDDILRGAPRPLALGFVGKPCRQAVLPLQLLHRGIYARDVFCAPAPAGAAPYDAVVFLPSATAIGAVSAEVDLAEIHRRLVDLLETDAPDAARLGLGVSLLLGEKPTKANRELAARLRQTTTVAKDLAERITDATSVGEFLFFIAPENVELKMLLQNSAVPWARPVHPPLTP